MLTLWKSPLAPLPPSGSGSPRSASATSTEQASFSPQGPRVVIAREHPKERLPRSFPGAEMHTDLRTRPRFDRPWSRAVLQTVQERFDGRAIWEVAVPAPIRVDS